MISDIYPDQNDFRFM